MRSLLFITILLFLVKPLAAQVLTDAKGTKITVDSSKWKLSGTDIYAKNSGNVGIGNTAPAYKLDITGKLRVSDSLVTNSARVISLVSGTISDSLVVADATTGVLKRIASSRISGTSGGWSLTGNAGTSAGTNFLGTTDQQDLVFKVGNPTFAGPVIESGRLSVFNGKTAFGVSASAADSSVAVGTIAANSSNQSVAVGAATTSTFRSVALGYKANNSSSESVAIGYAATAAFQAVTVGSASSTTGNDAISIGQAATAGFQSSAVGANTSATGNNSAAIGFNATTSQANAFILGNNSVNVGIGTSTPNTNAKLDVNGTYKLGSNGTVHKNAISFTANINNTVNSGTMTVAFLGGSGTYSSASLDVDITIPAANRPGSTQATVIVSPAFDLPGQVSIASARLTSTSNVRVRFINNESVNSRTISGTLNITISEF